MAPVKRSKITVNQFPIYDHLVKRLEGHDDVVDLGDEEVIKLFIDIVDTTTIKILEICELPVEVRTFGDFYTSSRDVKKLAQTKPHIIPSKKEPKETGYKWETINSLWTGSGAFGPASVHTSWYVTNLSKEQDKFAAFYLHEARDTHTYNAFVARNLLQSFILFLRGEEKFKEMWALGLIDPCAFTITSAINTHNRLVKDA